MEAVVFEHLDRHPADRRLVVVRAAGMEVDDRPLGGGADVFSRPALESSSREAWERGVTVNAEQALAKPTQRAVPQRPVRQGGNRCPEPSEHARPGDQLVTERDTPVLPELRPRLRVDLRDLHSLRTDLRADPATRAVVERDIGRDAGAAEPLRLGPDVLRAGEERRRLRVRAERLADRALHAVVEGVAYELGHYPASRIAEAAAYPDARLRPLPEPSRHGTAPARVAPAAWRFS